MNFEIPAVLHEKEQKSPNSFRCQRNAQSKFIHTNRILLSSSSVVSPKPRHATDHRSQRRFHDGLKTIVAERDVRKW